VVDYFLRYAEFLLATFPEAALYVDTLLEIVEIFTMIFPQFSESLQESSKSSELYNGNIYFI
jgi:hypothetical protein